MRFAGCSVAVALTAAGCAQIFGLDETSEIADDSNASFTLTRTAIGVNVLSEPFDLTPVTGNFLVPDATSVSGFRKVAPIIAAPGQWRANVPEGNAMEFEYAAPGEPIRHFALANRKLSSTSFTFGKLKNDPAPRGAAFDFDVTFATPFAAGHALAWHSVGAWASHPYAAAELPAVGATVFKPPSFLYTGTQRVTIDDSVLFLHYNGRQLIGQLTAAPFEQTEAATVIAGRLTPVALDQSLSLTLDTTAPATRLARAEPKLGAAAMTWQLNVSPGGELSFATGPFQHGGNPAINTGMVPVVALYGNPFAARNWISMFAATATASRTFTPVGQGPVNLIGRLQMLMLPPSDGRAVGFQSCLPTSVAIQGQSLITDGLTVALDRTKPVSVTLISDTLEVDLYNLTLFEVVGQPGPPPTSVLVSRFQSVSVKPTWTLPNDLFGGGKTYSLRVVCSKGPYPKFAEGDLSTRQPPLFTGLLDGGVFTVAP